ncbi:MAG TPA: imidazolonepropionase [Gemmatimonadales bacterium]|nr:imidazolonepropionase [Gemmatimonadales bacterium]
MKVLGNISQLATCRAEGGQGDIHPVADAALAWEGDSVRWAGAEKELPEEFHGAERLDAGRRLVIPGLIDCHTHLAFGGWRADEFERRILGHSYLELARSGGGIASTVRHTREATDEQLLARGTRFLSEMLALGVTTVECKSGYGLSLEAELKLLRVYRELAARQSVRIVPTFLGAHIVPPEFRENRAGYVDLLVESMIPAVVAEKLAVFCDVFVEESAFSVSEARRVLQAGQSRGLASKVHADQLSSAGGAELAGEVGACSAEHLEHISERGIDAMRKAGVVAVSLPVASLYLGQPAMPARRLIERGVAVAVATDFNPGSAPSYHLPLALTLACTLQHMTPAEALKGATIYAARAVGLERSTGSLESGKAADFAVIDAPDVNHWIYHFRPNACVTTVIGGITRWTSRAHDPNHSS